MIRYIALFFFQQASFRTNGERALSGQVQFQLRQRGGRGVKIEDQAFWSMFASHRPVEQYVLLAWLIDEESGLYSVEIADYRAAILKADLAEREG